MLTNVRKMYMDEVEVHYQFKYFLMPLTGFRLEHSRTVPCVQCGVINCLFDIAYSYSIKPNSIRKKFNIDKISRVTGLYCCSDGCFNMFLLRDGTVELYADGHMEITGG